MAKAMSVAAYIIKEANKNELKISNLQLQKVMYFLNVISLLKNKNKPLINDNNFEKWSYGPVINEVYSTYSGYRSSPITYPKKNRVLQKNKNGFYKIVEEDFKDDDLNKDERDIVKSYLEIFLEQDPFDLVKESHEETQWKELNKTDEYSTEDTIAFYQEEKHRFWEKF